MSVENKGTEELVKLNKTIKDLSNTLISYQEQINTSFARAEEENLSDEARVNKIKQVLAQTELSAEGRLKEINKFLPKSKDNDPFMQIEDLLQKAQSLLSTLELIVRINNSEPFVKLTMEEINSHLNTTAKTVAQLESENHVTTTDYLPAPLAVLDSYLTMPLYDVFKAITEKLAIWTHTLSAKTQPKQTLENTRSTLFHKLRELEKALKIDETQQATSNNSPIRPH